jgi:hypothetical protein
MPKTQQKSAKLLNNFGRRGIEFFSDVAQAVIGNKSSFCVLCELGENSSLNGRDFQLPGKILTKLTKNTKFFLPGFEYTIRFSTTLNAIGRNFDVINKPTLVAFEDAGRFIKSCYKTEFNDLACKFIQVKNHLTEYPCLPA